MIDVEEQLRRARHIHEAERLHGLDAVGLHQWLLAQRAREPLSLEMPGEAELIAVQPHRAREIDRALADLILDHLQHDDVRPLEIRAAEHLRIDGDIDRAQPGGAFLVEDVVLLERGELLVAEAHQFAGGLGPLPATVDRGRFRAVESRDRTVLNLPQIPVGVGEREVDDRHVLTNALDLLRVPKRECVVVARRHQHAIGFDRLQQVVGEIAREGLALP